jgi:hypothetical protein
MELTCRRCGEIKAADQMANRGRGRPLCRACRAEEQRAWLKRTGYKGKQKTLTCPDCGAQRTYRATTSRPNPRCDPCSRKLRAAPPDARQRQLAKTRETRRIRAAARAAARRNLFVGGVCRGCGASFVERWSPDGGYGASPRYCGKTCRLRTRSSERKDRFTPAQRRAIFERDNWVCRICKRRVSRVKVWPHPSSPVVDHVIPLAAGAENGGVHAPHNWQCAHKRCNSAKSDACSQVAIW